MFNGSRIVRKNIFRVLNDPKCVLRPLHSSAVVHKRRGPVSDVRLPELIVDKQPDYYDTIQQKLDRINYYDTKPNEVNVGYASDNMVQQNFSKNADSIVKNLKFAAESEQDLLAEFEETKQTASLNDDQYERLFQIHRFTREYQDATVSLAHHYGIFRDLFNSGTNELDRATLSANARDELDANSLKQSPTFAFKPIVPFDVEFAREDAQDPDSMLCQRVYRGNLIPSEYGAERPQLTINALAINGQVGNPSELFRSENNSSNSVVELLDRNSGEQPAQYYTMAMVNLDSHFADSGVCHWMVGNIRREGDGSTVSEEVVKYLPVYGIRGLGYHRYCFVLFRHTTQLDLARVDDFDLGSRRFDVRKFMEQHQAGQPVPVGLSWFQTSWSEQCADVYHKFLDMRSPTYEYEHPQQVSEFKQLHYPGRAPFNLYLDHFRDPKELAKEVLLERLSTIDVTKSYDSEKMYSKWDGKPQFPHIHPLDSNTPDWAKSAALKKRAMVGRYRGLRPASARLPYNNNADLDQPQWPRISPDVLPLNCPNPYPDGHRRPRALRDSLWTVPVPDHHSLRVDFANQLTESDRKQLDQTESKKSDS